MYDREWREILNGINFYNLSHENIIYRIQERLLATEHHDIYRKWERSNFDINYLFAFQSEYTNGKRTLLHLAASYGLTDVVEALLENNANVNAKDQDYATPLHQAALSGNAGIVAILLANGAKVNAKDQDYTTPLHCAVISNNGDVVAVLLNNGAGPSLKNKDSKTPINLAQDNNIKHLLNRARKRQILKLTIMSFISVFAIAFEVIIAMWYLAQENVHSVTIPMMMIFTALTAVTLATIDCVVTNEIFDIDEINTGNPNTETNEIQIEERSGVEVSAV